MQRKSLARIFTLVLIACCLLSVFPASAERETVTIADDFDNASVIGGYDLELWSAYASDGAFAVEQITDPEMALQFKGKNANGENTVLISKDWYWELYSLSFDLKFPSTGSWFGLDFPDIIEPEDYLGDFKDKGDPMCYGSMMASETDDFGFADTNWSDWGFGSDNIAGKWVSIKIVPKNEKTATIYMAPRGYSFDTSKGKEVTLSDGRSFHNCNIVFTDYAFSGYMLDNIVIETDTGTYTEDFNDASDDLFELITLISNPSEFSTQVVEDGAVRKLCISGAEKGDRLLTNDAIKQEDTYLNDTEQVLSTAFTVDLSNSGGEEKLAYVFGISDTYEDPFLRSYALVFDKNGCQMVHYDAEGTETVLAQGSFRSAMKGSTLSLTVLKYGSFTVSENGRKLLSGDGITEYAGYTGFAAATDITGKIYLDDVTVDNGIYRVITTKSFADDFSQNRLGSNGNSDYAINEVSGSISVNDGELSYNGCLDGTFFGPAYEYETFELTFELTSILATDNENEIQNATYLDRWIGIDFGKKNVNTTTYGSYGMFLIRVRPGDTETAWETATSALYKVESISPLKGETYTQVRPIPASYFTDITYDEKTVQREDISPDAAVCFKLVAEKNLISLYMKRADETEYTLYSTLKGAKPEGYFGITCTGWSYWTIDNFSVTNTAEIYNEAPEVVIEEPELVSYADRGLDTVDTGWEEEVALNASHVADEGTPAWVLPVAVVAAVIALAAVVTVCVITHRKKKEAGKANEEV